MKIIVVENNTEKTNKNAQPQIFLRPDSALARSDRPFFLPDCAPNFTTNIFPVIRINRLGKSIEQRFAKRYYAEIALGVCFTAEGIDPCIARSIDGSAVLSDFFITDNFDNISFRLVINQSIEYEGITGNLNFHFDEIIAYLSRFFTFKMGDLIFAGTHEKNIKIQIGNHIEGFLNDRKIIDFYIK